MSGNFSIIAIIPFKSWMYKFEMAYMVLFLLNDEYALLLFLKIIYFTSLKELEYEKNHNSTHLSFSAYF
jgi:hypothetical protein